MVAVAVAAWLAFGVLPTYDSLYSLVWGREILDGAAPGFDGLRRADAAPAVGRGRDRCSRRSATPARAR